MRRRYQVILIAVLLTVVVVGILIALFFLSSTITQHPVSVTPQLECNVLDSGVLDYGGSSKLIYLLTQVNGKDIQSVTAKVSLYDSELPRDIYLLDYSSPSSRGCYECNGLPEFKKSLEESLKQYNLMDVNSTLNQIKINQLDRLTRRSILIVPTGKIPAQLVGLENGSDLNNLMRKGFVVIFIGSDLSEALYSNGNVGPIQPDALGRYGFSYSPNPDIQTCNGYNLQNPAFSISTNTIGCSISYIRNGEGYFIVFPRSIDIGWNSNGTIAAQDVARLIYEVGWKSPITTGSLVIPAGMINSSNSGSSMIYLKPSLTFSGWARIVLTTKSLNNTPFYLILNRQISSSINGKMLQEEQAVTGSNILINFQLSENFSTPRDVNISVIAYNNNQYVNKQFANSIKIQNEFTISSNFNVNLSVGNYTLRAEDDNGHVYAQSFLSVPQIQVTINPLWGAEPQSFDFNLRVPSDPLSIIPGTSPLPYQLAYVTVNSTPGVNLFPPFYNTSDSSGLFIYAPSQTLTFGSYTFNVNISGQVMHINKTYPKPQSWLDNPINIGIIVATVIVAVIAVALRRPEKPMYTIDVPDFPPLEKVLVPISKFSILSLFDSVNKEYRWSFMPLTAPELKNEMRRKITYKGAPILITDYNLERVLDELIESGDVKKELNLYGLASWESKSGRSMMYLALFRLLRNFFINNAVPFTDLNQRRDCDMFATVKGESLYIHIYADESTLKRALELGEAGKNFIVFASRKELEEVLKRLDLSYSPMSVILKSEIGVGSIQLIHPGNFGEIVGK